MAFTRFALLAASALTLASCASIIEGSTDEIAINTSPAYAATCSATNTRGNWSTATPGTVKVKKSINDLEVVCQDPSTGVSGSKTVESEIEPWDFGNILIGGIIGMGIDWGTGAAYDYPDSVTVPIGSPQAQAVQPAAPVYYQAPAVTPAPVSAAPSVTYYPAQTVAPQATGSAVASPFGAPTPAPAGY